VKWDVVSRRVRKSTEEIIGALALCALGLTWAPQREEGIDIVEAPVAALQEAMSAGRITSRALTAQYLARIKAIGQGGPAHQLGDRGEPRCASPSRGTRQGAQRRRVRAGRCTASRAHQDNIATADRMQTTADRLRSSA